MPLTDLPRCRSIAQCLAAGWGSVRKCIWSSQPLQSRCPRPASYSAAVRVTATLLGGLEADAAALNVEVSGVSRVGIPLKMRYASSQRASATSPRGPRSMPR